MKTRTFVSFLILVSAVLIIAGSCATQKQAFVPKTNEELYGTWVNTDYDGVDHDQKFINYNWGYTEIFGLVTDQNVGLHGAFHIMDKWTDSEGIIWYKVTWQFRGTPNMRFYLVKIDESKGSWENVWSYKVFPSESDLTPEHVQYGIWYRHE
jgi:hypothetical protein